MDQTAKCGPTEVYEGYFDPERFVPSGSFIEASRIEKPEVIKQWWKNTDVLENSIYKKKVRKEPKRVLDNIKNVSLELVTWVCIALFVLAAVTVITIVMTRT